MKKGMRVIPEVKTYGIKPNLAVTCTTHASVLARVIDNSRK